MKTLANRLTQLERRRPAVTGGNHFDMEAYLDTLERRVCHDTGVDPDSLDKVARFHHTLATLEADTGDRFGLGSDVCTREQIVRIYAQVRTERLGRDDETVF